MQKQLGSKISSEPASNIAQSPFGDPMFTFWYLVVYGQHSLDLLVIR